MKTRLIIAVAALFIAGMIPSMAAAADAEVTTWDTATCEHTMTTNHFTLAPGESVEIPLTQSSCGVREGVLFFGYKTTKTQSRQLKARDGVRITVVDDATGEEFFSDSGSLFVAGETDSCVMYAENLNRRKSITVRLRSSVIW